MKFLRGLLLALAAVLLFATAAEADSVPVASVTATQFYSYCGGMTLLQAIQPDVAPPAAPEMACTIYNGGSGTMTARLGTHAAGTMTASAYVRTATHPGSVKMLVNGVQRGASVPLALSSEAWYSIPVDVAAGDAVDVVVTTSYTGTGQNRIGMVHGDLKRIFVGQPGNWARTQVPQDVAVDPSLTGAGLPMSTEFPKELRGQANGTSYVNTSAYTPKIYHVAADTPVQPVRLCRGANVSGVVQCVPSYGAFEDNMARVAMGVDNATTFDRVTGKALAPATYIGGGIPLTAEVEPAPGTDQEAVVCQDDWIAKNADGTDFVRPDGQKMEGRCFELWGLQPDETYDPNQPVSIDNTKWKIRTLVRRTGYIGRGDPATVDTTNRLDTLSSFYNRVTNALWYGPKVTVAGDPNSTAYWRGWSVTASGLPMWNDVVSSADCSAVAAGTAADFGHAVGIQLRFNRFQSIARWWPAYMSDGMSGSKLAAGEGMRGFIPASVSMPAGLNAWGQALFRTLQKYGFVDDDTTGGGTSLALNADGSYKSGGALNMRSDRGSTECASLGVSGAQLKLMPWESVTLIKQGNDAVPNPLT